MTVKMFVYLILISRDFSSMILFLRLLTSFRACLGRVTLASGLPLVGGQQVTRVYKQKFTDRVI